MTKPKSVFYIFMLIAAVIIGVGCNDQTLDPTQIGRFRPVPVVNVILDSLGVEDEPAPIYAGAEDPKPSDIINLEQDYVFGVSDIVRISIYELLRGGQNYVNDYTVTESGRVSIPEVGQIRAAGLTEAKLEDEIKDILSPNILLDPLVTVTLMQSQSQMVSVSGQGIGRSIRFPIPRYDFRLTDLIAIAGGIGEYNVSNIYVSRKVSGNELISPAISKTTPKSRLYSSKRAFTKSSNNNDEILGILEPYKRGSVNGGVVITSSEMETDLEKLTDPYGVLDAGIAVSQKQEPGGRIEWVFEDGKWLPIRVGKPLAAVEPIERETGFVAEEGIDTADYGWDQIGTAGAQTRVIRIPVDKLLGGDPKYNIVVRPGDSITVPMDSIGYFWVSGNVNRSGPISLTGMPITLKMAIASAGGLNAIAWPKKVEIIRRIGRNKEEIVMVDLDKIAKGLQPDFFIKPNDQINVGTHIVSRYLLVLRSGFRVNYSFNYSKNFGGDDFNDAVINVVDFF